MDTSSLIAALAPAFAAGFALQRLLEILDPILEKLASGNNKKIALGIVSLLCGAGLATWPQFRVLSHLVVPEGSISTWLDYLVTSLIISGGTEGVNSILKFLKYKKEDAKNEAASKAPANANAAAVAPAVVARSHVPVHRCGSTGPSMGRHPR